MQEKTKTIVLVDDDPDFLAMNRRILEKSGYRVLSFDDTMEAMRVMHEQKPDLLITDLMMAGMDTGFRFSREVKQDPLLKDVPVIIVTAVASRRGFSFRPQSRQELESIHADAYFDKPVSQPGFLDKVRELIGETVRNCKENER